MQLVMQKFNFTGITQSKAFQMVTFVALAALVVMLFTLLNDVSAITEASLSTTAAAGSSADKAGSTLNTPTLWVLSFMKGTGGLLAALLGLLLTLYSAFVAKSLVGVMLSVGIAVTALYGPDVIMNFMGAIA